MDIEVLAKPVLSMYRRMLRVAGRLPASDRTAAISQIRAAFREHRGEASTER